MANKKSKKKFSKCNPLDGVASSDGDRFAVRALARRAEKLPVVMVELKHFKNDLLDKSALKVWGGIFSMRDFAEHFDRTERADLRVPIMVRKSTGDVLDGHHRLIKAIIRHKKWVKVVYFEEWHLPFPLSQLGERHGNQEETYPHPTRAFRRGLLPGLLPVEHGQVP